MRKERSLCLECSCLYSALVPMCKVSLGAESRFLFFTEAFTLFSKHMHGHILEQPQWLEGKISEGRA